MHLLKRRLFLWAERVGIRTSEAVLALVLAAVIGISTYLSRPAPAKKVFPDDQYADFRTLFSARAKQALKEDSIKTARFHHPEAFIIAEKVADSVKKANKSGKSAKKGGEIVNINSASTVELVTLPGIGPKTAQDIVDFRTKNGPFKTIEGLMDVKGIGTKKFEKLKPYVIL